MIAILSWLNATKNLWLIGVIVVGSAGLFAAYKSHEAKEIATAVEATKAAISAGAVEAATKTAAAEREAFETTPLPANKPAIVDLCKRSASCRERGTLR
jgi:dihydrodipicolinate synthase/N-acetylneuraminate lyase